MPRQTPTMTPQLFPTAIHTILGRQQVAHQKRLQQTHPRQRLPIHHRKRNHQFRHCPLKKPRQTKIPRPTGLKVLVLLIPKSKREAGCRSLGLKLQCYQTQKAPVLCGLGRQALHHGEVNLPKLQAKSSERIRRCDKLSPENEMMTIQHARPLHQKPKGVQNRRLRAHAEGEVTGILRSQTMDLLLRSLDLLNRKLPRM